MNAGASDREVFASVLAEHAAARAGDHPGLDALVGYLADDLDAEAAARVNDHLVACRECTARLLDLEPLMRPDDGTPEGVADLAAAAAWRDLRHRAFDEAPRARPAAGRHWSTAVAASLLVATLGLSAWVARLAGTAGDLRQRVAELSRPLVNVPIAYVGATTRSTEGEPIEVPADAPRWLLVFTPAALEAYAEYEARFFDAQGGEALRIGGLELSESGGLRLLVAREGLPPAEYRVVLNGFDGEQWRQVEEHRFTVVEAAPGHG